MNLNWVDALQTETKKPILVCDVVEYGEDGFGRKPQRWRVTHHLKRIEDTLDERLAQATDIGERVTLEICLEFREKERKQRIKNKQRAKRRYSFLYCKPEEATHVSLTAVCGATAPISECIRRGTVPWTPEHIEQTRAAAVSDFWLSNNFSRDWRWE